VHGRVTNEAGAPLADVRVLVAIPATDMRFLNSTASVRKLDARTDAKGQYRLKISGIAKPTMISLDAMKPGYRRLVGTLMRGGDARTIQVAPGVELQASMGLVPGLYFAGVVVDEKGKPIPDVEISADSNTSISSGGVERTASNSDGSFELFNYPAVPEVFGKEVERGVVTFFHPDYISHHIEDVYALAPEEGKYLHIVLSTGYRISGILLDVAGKPVPHAMIKVTRGDESHRKATLSDADGKFVLRGLSPGQTTLIAHAYPIKQKIQLRMDLEGDRDGLKVRLQAMPLPANLKKYSVLGMQLTDVTPDLRSAYDLWSKSGALILDPGKNSGRLGIGELAEGYSFWMVGQKRVGSVRELVERVLAEAGGQTAPKHYIRIVYTFSRVDFEGTNTQYMKLTKDDLADLQKVLDDFGKPSK